MNYLSPTVFALLLAGIAGAALPTQTGINSLLAKSWTGPLWAAFISFVVGAVALLAVLLATKQTPPPINGLSKIEWWYFTGGLLGVFYVAVATFAAPVIGATQLVALVIGGQLIMSILLDHFGLFGFAKLPLDITRLIGLSLMIAGVILIKK